MSRTFASILAGFLVASCIAGGLASPSTALSAPVLGYEVVDVFPHDSKAFTQGLIVRGDILYESTGLYGESTIRKVDLESGIVLLQSDLAPELFGEGLAAIDDVFYQLTWQNNIGFTWTEADTFEVLEEFVHPWDGWGLTYDGLHLIASDGSSTLRFLDPITRDLVSEVQVRDGLDEVRSLNEMEYIGGKIFSNVLGSERIAIIDPGTGVVESWIDLSGLRDSLETGGSLNGIAYEEEDGRLFVTGKRWPKLFEILLPPLGPVSVDPTIANESLAVLDALPNPVRGGRIELQLPSALGVGSRVRVLDITGRTVLESSHPAVARGTRSLILELDRLSPGLYIVTHEAAHRFESRKLVVIR